MEQAAEPAVTVCSMSSTGTLEGQSIFEEIRIPRIEDRQALLEIAERNVTRSLTDEECRQYLHLVTSPPS